MWKLPNGWNDDDGGDNGYVGEKEEQEDKVEEENHT